ncbi:MAG: hypothetical protein ACRDKI_06495 [Solirubrobacterales bacterium]
MSTAITWPPITEPKLLERLALDDDAFDAFCDRLFGLVPPRTHAAGDTEYALGYPWERPARSYRLIEGAVEPLEEMSPLAGRFPLLAYGSNASPEGLGRKLAALPAQQQRVDVVLGRLHDFDVGASAHAAVYGALPATIFASPGCAVDCAVLLVSAEQLTAIAWPEISYAFGALSGARFETELGELGAGELFAFASRRGAIAPEGAPVAMAAVSAHGRSADAWSQRELIEHAARAAMGSEATAEQLVGALFAEYAPVAARLAVALRDEAAHFAASQWLPYPL